MECHGGREDAPKTISELYDEAFDYQLGDLRGLMSIKLPADFVEDEIWAQRLDNLYKHLATFLVAFALGTWLLRILVIRRLEKLKSAAGALANGDYHARVSEKGQDELRNVAATFNNMAGSRQQRAPPRHPDSRSRPAWR